MSVAPKLVAERAELLRRSARWDRMRARAPRLLFAAAAVILSLLGARELVSPTETSPAAAGASVDHPAEDLAQRFARAYLTHEPGRPGARERRLRGLVSDELEREGARLAREPQRVLWTQVAQNQEAIAGGRVIVVGAGVSTQAEPVYLAVPVFRDEGGAVGLAGYPALVGPPSLSAEAPEDREEVDDRQIVSVARRAVANYLAAETRNLAADLAPGARVSPPSRELRVTSVDQVAWASGAGSSAVLVTVVARDADRSEWTLTYEVGIDRGGDRPYVTFIETVPNAP